eukprot:183256_1
MMDSSTNYMVSSLLSVLQESLFKLELLKLICHNDTTTLPMILKDDEHGNSKLELIKEMSNLMEEYISILSDPELEFTSNTITLLDSVKQNINIQFHEINVEALKTINQTSLNIHEIINLNKENMNTTTNNNTNEEQWENIANSFVEYLEISTNTFKELSEKHKLTKTAETAKDTINKLIQEYKINKHKYDELELILYKDRD